MSKVLSIHYPDVYIQGEDKVNVSLLPPSVRVGCEVEKDKDGRWKITVNNVDQDCVGGACPIK